ncbi:MAG: glycosyltransferase [Oligoflexales bacterium]
MRIDQFLPSFARYDAIGSHVRSIQKFLREKGFVSDIFTELYRDDTKDFTAPVSHYAKHAHPDNIIVYHHSIASNIPMTLMSTPGFVVTVYHNVTPFTFFDNKRDRLVRNECLLGILQNEIMKLRTNYFWHVSKFNSQDFEDSGIESVVLPLLRDFETLAREPADLKITSALKNDKKTILFVGRLAPHKCQHTMIGLLKTVRDIYDKKVRLILVGGGSEEYVNLLLSLSKELGMVATHDLVNNEADVCIMPNLTDAQLASVYRLADLFLCLSDHEGFCVPLVEAMHFGLPIIAHPSSAIAETCGTGGSLIDKKDTVRLVKSIVSALDNDAAKAELKERSHARARDFEFSVLKSHFDKALDNTLKLKDKSRK